MNKSTTLLASAALAILLACIVAVLAGMPGFGQTVTPAATATLVGAGDIARCDASYDEQTAQLINHELRSLTSDGTLPSLDRARVMTLGDNAYSSGTRTQFANCYDNYNLDSTWSTYNSSRPAWWGQYKDRTMPTTGNHEYLNSTDPSIQSLPYFDYFSAVDDPLYQYDFKPPAAPVPNAADNPGLTRGDPGSGQAKGYYSYDLGSWHIVVLNSNCDYTGCDSNSAQANWLDTDLTNHPVQCTLAYMHHPLYANGTGGLEPRLKPLWQILYNHGADVILNGHDHRYERLARIDPNDNKDLAYGIRPLIAGTGGDPGGGTTETNEPNSEVHIYGTAGILRMDLSDGYYSWAFVAADGTPTGKVMDSTANPLDPSYGVENPPNSTNPAGTEACHGAPGSSNTGSTDTTPPTLTKIAPASSATDVPFTTNVEATFSEDMDPSTISGSTFTLQHGSDPAVSASVSYDSATHKATLDPATDLQAATTYTATIKGGTAGVKDLAGNALASDTSWSFTTAPAAPSNLAATRSGSPGNQSINLSWTDNSSYEAGFVIERSKDKNFTTIEKTYNTPANTTSYRDSSSLLKKTTYYYRVFALSSTGTRSGSSNVATVSTK
jgi:hypothetical protein